MTGVDPKSNPSVSDLSSIDLSDFEFSDSSKSISKALRAIGVGAVALAPLASATEVASSEVSPPAASATAETERELDIVRYSLREIQLPEFRENYENYYNGEILHDVIIHSPRGPSKPSRGHYSPATEAHETCHRVNNFITLEYGNLPENHNPIEYPGCQLNQVEGVYLGDGRAVVVKAAKTFELIDVAKAVPRALRGPNYDLYLVKRDRIPGTGAPMYSSTYVFDEASAFARDALTALEHHDDPYYQNKLRQGIRIAETQGAGEFIAYLLAYGYNVEKNSQSYENPADRAQALGTIQELVEVLADVYQRGLDSERYPVFSSGERHFLTTLRNDPGAESLRKFAAETYGEDWLESLFR